MTPLKTIKLVTILLFIISNTSCGQGSKKNDEIQKPDKEQVSQYGTIATANVDYDTYLELRNALLDINPAEFGFKKSNDRTKLFGIVIDLNQNDTIKTISAYKTGDVSVYNSTGMLYMAGVQVKRFKEMAIDFTNESENLIKLLENTNFNRDLPKLGFVKFYLITNNGIRQYEYEVTNSKNQKPDWNTAINKGLEIEKAYLDALKK